jgi:taurine dioxygenase
MARRQGKAWRMTIEVRPLDGAVGAEIVGLDARLELTDDDFRVVEGALFDHVAVVISDIEENPDWLVDLGRRFGPLVPHVLNQYHHPKTPEISIIAANTGGPESRSSFRPAGAYWHSDLSYMAKPSDAILLYSSQVPTDGGDTLVANMVHAYQALPRVTKQRIDRWVAVHRYGKGGGGLTPEQRAKVPDVVEHPVVRVHPRTGQRVLFVNPGFTFRIKGKEPTESKALLAALFRHALRPEFQYRHQWKRRQLLVIDNRASMHKAVADYTEPRRLLRMIVGCTGGVAGVARKPPPDRWIRIV